MTLNRTSAIKEISILSLLLLAVGVSVAEQGNSILVSRAFETCFRHIRYLGMYPTPMSDGKMEFWIRSRLPEAPGDYFRCPEKADTTTLTDSDYSQVVHLLEDNIPRRFYDSYVLAHVIGYEYTMAKGSIHRREYYVSYARGDTIYVISGWLGKFLSFYRAIPGDFRYEVSQLQAEVQKLVLSYRETKEDSYKKIDEEKNYFLEYINRENMLRVRNYLVDATFIFDDSRQAAKTTYNVIEITKFIDPEVMP
jgi:hypothetical protein